MDGAVKLMRAPGGDNDRFDARLRTEFFLKASTDTRFVFEPK